MSEYVVKVGFWLRAFGSVTVEAHSDAEAMAMAKEAASGFMESHSWPEAFDFDERREGVISYIDRIDADDRTEVAGFMCFDDDRIHAFLREFLARMAELPTKTIDKDEALLRYRALIDEARALFARAA